MPTLVVGKAGLAQLIAALIEDGYEVVGPTLGEGAIVHDIVESIDDLPKGWGDQQDAGKYRLTDRGDEALFSYNLGPTTWKQFLFPPTTELLRITTSGGKMSVVGNGPEKRKRAFLGARACELAAISIQDEVFINSGHTDRTYSQLRRDLFIVAVNCGTTTDTCFCVSMGTGPECTTGFDLVITEILTGSEPQYLLTSGSNDGTSMLARLDGQAPDPTHLAAKDELLDSTANQMGRTLETDGLYELLVDNPDHPRWDDVAARCLTCGNCTLACPTCFCSNVTDTVTLDGVAIRSRVWDSCFGLEFTALHGHPVRGSAKSRYRQWMTHKLATWHDQFGSSGCVGCGRCITWCPVGIDITEEVTAMKAATV